MEEATEAAVGSNRVVVIGIDGSNDAKEAFHFYVNSVRKENDKVYLVHCVEINSVLHSTQWFGSPYSFDKDMLTKLLDEEKIKIKHKLEQFAILLQESGVDGTVKSIHSESAGYGICKAADEVNASLIIVATRGLGKLRRTFMGSVSDYVVHHSHVPVLICKHSDPERQQHHEN